MDAIAFHEVPRAVAVHLPGSECAAVRRVKARLALAAGVLKLPNHVHTRAQRRRRGRWGRWRRRHQHRCWRGRLAPTMAGRARPGNHLAVPDVGVAYSQRVGR